MRILQISSAKSFGGGEKHLADLIRGLAARGHEVFLAAPENSVLRGKLTRLKDENFINAGIRHALDIPAAFKIAGIIREKNIDIVHAHLARDYVPASLAVRLASTAGPASAAGPTGATKAAKFVLTRHVLFPMKGLHRLALSNVSRVIAVSSAVEKQLRTQRVFPPEKIVTIPNGIDVEHWAGGPVEEMRMAFRAKHQIPDDAFLIGAIGELKKLKGQEDLILAAEMILQKFPGARFVIVGHDNSPDGGYRVHLQNLAAAIGAADNFIWLDWVDDTAPLLHALDVFVSASHTESFGLAILEAMAAARAVVSTGTEGAKELLGEKYLVPPIPVEDPVRLATAVCSLLDDEAARKELGRSLQVRAAENFDLETMINATEKLYLELQDAG